MTVQNREKFFEEHWDWGFLKAAGCFGGTKIEPTDVDGMTERNGYFILIEAKSPGVIVKQGQKLLQASLVDTGVFTVVNMWGTARTQNVQELEVLQSHLFRYKRTPATLSDLIALHTKWFNRVESLPPARTVDTQYLHKQIRSLRDSYQNLQDRHQKLRGEYAELMRDYLIEKSGSFVSDGWHEREADLEAARMTAEKYSVGMDFCLKILRRLP